MRLKDNVIKLDCTKGSYAYAMIHDGVTLVDSSIPGRGEAILSELKSYSIMPNDIKRILVTHHDIDHIGNVEYLMAKCKCEAYISEADLPYVLGMKKRHGIKKVLGMLMKASVPKTVKAFDTRTISGIEILPAAGHTNGHTCFRFNDVFFAGDLCSSKDGKLVLPPKIMTWDMKKNIDSCKALKLDGVKWICTAHGEPVNDNKAWNLFLQSLL